MNYFNNQSENRENETEKRIEYIKNLKRDKMIKSKFSTHIKNYSNSVSKDNIPIDDNIVK